MADSITQYPARLQRLEPGDPGFPHPYNRRFRIEMADGDAFYFFTQDEAVRFGCMHAIRFIDDAQMDAIRRELFGRPRADGEAGESI